MDIRCIDVVDLIYIIYGTLNIDAVSLIASLYDAPETVAFINGDLNISPYRGSLSIARTDNGVSGKDQYHDAYCYEQEEPERLYYSVMMSSVFFHFVHHLLSIKQIKHLFDILAL